MMGATRPHEGDGPVVHVRNVADFTQPAQIAETFQPYGVINYILQMANGRQALVEFENVDSAVRLVSQSAEGVYIGQQQVYVNYSKSQSINRSRGGYDPSRGMVGPSLDGPGGGGAPKPRRDNGGPSGQPTHILFMTVDNAQFPITTEVIYQICSPHGQILRIVIIRRAMPQCLVEFQNVDSAARAAAALHGADIYSGCCTLSVEFSATPTLNVRRNDDTTMDYTADFQNGPGGPGRGGYQKPALSVPPQHMGHQNPHFGGGSGGYGQHGQHGQHGQPGQHAQPGQHRGGSYGGYPPQGAPGGAPGGGGPVVLMVYNMDAVMDPTKLFNLLCVYGNVTKIKFLVRKEGTAMVEFQDANFARIAKDSLDKTVVCGKEVDIRYSKATYIGGAPGADQLENGAEAFVSWDPNSPSHRFRHGPGSQIYRPTNTIFFSNAPPGCTMELLQNECLKNASHSPSSHAFFNKEGQDPNRKASGLLEYASVEEATDVLVYCNNITIKTDKGFHTVKLNFSNSKTFKQGEGPVSTGAAAAPVVGTQEAAVVNEVA